MSYLDDIYSQTEDTFEDNLSWCFAVAHVIYHETSATDILDRMQWRHARFAEGCFDNIRGDNPLNYSALDWPESEILWALRTNAITEDDLLEFADMVNDYDEAYRAGKDVSKH